MVSFYYFNRRYGVPAKRGVRVCYSSGVDQSKTELPKSFKGERYGVITSAGSYVNVRVDGDKRARPFHPCSLVYLVDDPELVKVLKAIECTEQALINGNDADAAKGLRMIRHAARLRNAVWRVEDDH